MSNIDERLKNLPPLEGHRGVPAELRRPDYDLEGGKARCHM